MSGAAPRDSWRGHPIYRSMEGVWYYADGVPVSEDPNRTCGYCNRPSDSEGHDPCLRGLPGVTNACCGHGAKSESYIQFENGTTVRGFTIDPTS